MRKFDWKKWWPDLLIGLVFIIASALYFTPALQGKIIFAGDNVNGTAASREGNVWLEDHPEGSWWCGSMFSGMPNYQIGGHGSFAVDRIMHPLRWVFSWGLLNTYFIFLFYLVAFFLLLRTFKINRWLSLAGSFAIALSSYFFVIIAAQHHGKCYSITWMTLVVVGFILTYRKQYGWGALMTMFFTYIGFFLHPQMSYYICMMIGIFWFAELAIAVRDKEWKHFGLATLIWFASFGVGMGMGSANVFANQEYANETMRGGHSDLKKTTDKENKTKGLDLDYATDWSYGIDETMTFLIPNWEGGASGYNVGKDSELCSEMVKHLVPRHDAVEFCKQVPTYHGDKAFTSGPVYMGAIICFLFLLGLLIVDGPYKWALLVATLFSVFLAWGRHFMPLTQLFFEYFPMYNKFRAVESILIVAEITMPLLAMLALKTISEGKISWKRLKISLYIAGGVTAFFCLFGVLAAGMMDMSCEADEQIAKQVPQWLMDAILDERVAMLKADAWRSLLFVALGFAATWWYAKQMTALSAVKSGKEDLKGEEKRKSYTMYFGIALTALVVLDMWPVDKRFCNDDYFVSKRERDREFVMKPYEEEILKDKDYFRVLNFENPFNDARTSYYLKSIGGYSAAKLRRYQDLIEEHIAPEMNAFYGCLLMDQQGNVWVSPKCDSVAPVLNMLNMRYAILPMQQGDPKVVKNPYAMGNAWFVDELKVVDNANQECDALKTINLHTTAVLDKQFQDKMGSKQTAHDSTATIVLAEPYAPNKLVYKAHTKQPKTAVFSEIYYPYGWHVTIDGQPADLYRVNYMLRAVNVPAGDHEIVMTFEPESVQKGNKIAMACFAVFMLTLLATIGWEIYKTRKARKD